MNISLWKNNSTEEETFEYYKSWNSKTPELHVIYWDGIFNYPDQ